MPLASWQYLLARSARRRPLRGSVARLTTNTQFLFEPHNGLRGARPERAEKLYMKRAALEGAARENCAENGPVTRLSWRGLPAGFHPPRWPCGFPPPGCSVAPLL